MKFVLKTAVLILGAAQIVIPVCAYFSNGNDNTMDFLKLLFLGLMNAAIYFAVIYLFRQNEQLEKRVDDLENRLDKHYEVLKEIDNANNEKEINDPKNEESARVS